MSSPREPPPDPSEGQGRAGQPPEPAAPPPSGGQPPAPQGWGSPAPGWQPPYYYQQSVDTTHPKKRPRIFIWVFLAIQAIFTILIIIGVVGSSNSQNCAGRTGDELTKCQNAGNFGTFVGVVLTIGLWVTVDIILGISYLLYRLSRRDRT